MTERSWSVATTGSKVRKVRLLPLARYVEAALAQAEDERDENGVAIARVPRALGFFAQGDTAEEAHTNLRNVIGETCSSRSRWSCRSRQRGTSQLSGTNADVMTALRRAAGSQLSAASVYTLRAAMLRWNSLAPLATHCSQLV
jgi:Tfp pilus assembly protein PilF